MAYLERYRADCVTTGKDVLLVRPGRRELAHALSVDDQFRLGGIWLFGY